MTYKQIDLIGVSNESIEEAIINAHRKASETLKNIQWFEVKEIRGNFDKGNPTFQVILKLGFKLQD